MADGSVRSIELIKIGDEVQSTVGVRKVILVGTPQRGQRTLYQINNLNVFATSAHPFRSVESERPKRLAVDDWALLEGFPTMIEEGIGRLQTDCQLAGWAKTGTESVTVEQIIAHNPNDDEEWVYDLLLENWSKDDASYLVGGPEIFVAVDSESADSMYDLLGTVAILTTIKIALPVCRQYLMNPTIQLPALLARLQLDDLRDLAHQSAIASAATNLKLPSVPVPTDYMQGGKWDVHASVLDFHLVKQFSPLLRREAAMGWCMPSRSTLDNAHFTLCVYELVLLGAFPIPASKPLELQFNLRRKQGDTVKTMTLEPCSKSVWAMIVDQVIDFGLVNQSDQLGGIIGNLKLDNELFGVFRVAINEIVTSSTEHFIFNLAGQVIGRIAVEHRFMNANDLDTEYQQSQQWTKRQATSLAISLGTQLGHKLVAAIQKEAIAPL